MYNGNIFLIFLLIKYFTRIQKVYKLQKSFFESDILFKTCKTYLEMFRQINKFF